MHGIQGGYADEQCYLNNKFSKQKQKTDVENILHGLCFI